MIIPGTEMTLGIIRCDKSVNDEIIKNDANITKDKNFRVNPNFKNSNKNRIPVNNSTNGYFTDILVLQYRHLPPKKI
jgi:hypothetical protein